MLIILFKFRGVSAVQRICFKSAVLHAYSHDTRRNQAGGVLRLGLGLGFSLSMLWGGGELRLGLALSPSSHREKIYINIVASCGVMAC